MRFLHPETGERIGLHFEHRCREGRKGRTEESTVLSLWNQDKKEPLDGTGYPVEVRKHPHDVPNREIARQCAVRKMLHAFHADGKPEFAKRVGSAYFERSKKEGKRRMPKSVTLKRFRYPLPLDGIREWDAVMEDLRDDYR